jgi:hypothetical protein
VSLEHLLSDLQHDRKPLLDGRGDPGRHLRGGVPVVGAHGAAALLAAHQAREVKTIGDALMLRSGDAAAAIRLGLCIVHDVGAQHGFPLVRVGMHTGPAVEREGDWFGATVNLAARVSAAAAGGEALLTAATSDAAGQLAGMELRERGRWTFRNVTEPVQVYAAVREGARSAAGLPVDPVCWMAVDPWHSAGRLTHEGVEYCFCSLGRPCSPAPRPAASRGSCGPWTGSRW